MRDLTEENTWALLVSILIFIILYASGGCNRPMTRTEQVLFGGMIAAQAADGWTTDRYIGIGGTELNPMLGERPDTEAIALLKVGTVLTLWGLGEIWPDHREAFFTVGIVSGGVAAGYNDKLYEKYKGYRHE